MNEKINSVKDNAKQAFRELVSFSGRSKEEEDFEEQVTTVSSVKKEERKSLLNMQMPEIEIKKVTPTSVISADVVIEGNLITGGSLDFSGKIKGNLQAKGAVTMSGEQAGDIICHQIRFCRAKITGEVKATGTVEIDSETKITGNVFGKNVYIDGVVKGNVQAEELASLRNNGELEGNLQSGRLSIEEGAKIVSSISVKTVKKPD